MAAPREALKHKLLVLAGLPPGHPTDQELDQIMADIRAVMRERTPTDVDWKDAAAMHVPGAGRHKYAGENMADLNALLMQIQNLGPSGQAGSQKK